MTSHGGRVGDPIEPGVRVWRGQLAELNRETPGSRVASSARLLAALLLAIGSLHCTARDGDDGADTERAQATQPPNVLLVVWDIVRGRARTSAGV